MAGDLTEFPDDETFRILLCTDTHLGYLEKDEIRGNDSFRSFDEALGLAKKHNCDFVLHSGDLFHINKPSRNTIQKCFQILTKHCFGNNPVKFQIVSDQTKNFVDRGHVNFEDPNFNVALPIFGIHGNHDDPAGFQNHSAMDLLSITNYWNYFGRQDNLEDIQIHPILFTKGKTRIAIYGLGHIRDERLFYAFQRRKVKWIRPKQEKEKWFNIMCIHQNRVRRGSNKDSIPEEMLPKFLDVVYFGHEHGCLIELEESTTGRFHCTQPGSTVATSLSVDEARPKYAGIMEIRGEECRIVPVRLKTMRPFLIEDIVLDDHFERDVDQDDITEHLAGQVKIMIERAKKEFPVPDQDYFGIKNVNADGVDYTRLPLIRMRVDYTGFQKLNAIRFGQQFVNIVANPEEIIHCTKKNRRQVGMDEMRQGLGLVELSGDCSETRPIKDLVYDMLQQAKTPMELIPEPDMANAVQNFVVKQDNGAITDFVDKYLNDVRKALFGDGTIKSGANMGNDINKVAFQKAEARRNQVYAKRAAAQLHEAGENAEDAPKDAAPAPAPSASQQRVLDQEDEKRHEVDDVPDAPQPPKKKRRVGKRGAKRKDAGEDPAAAQQGIDSFLQQVGAPAPDAAARAVEPQAKRQRTDGAAVIDLSQVPDAEEDDDPQVDRKPNIKEKKFAMRKARRKKGKARSFEWT